MKIGISMSFTGSQVNQLTIGILLVRKVVESMLVLNVLLHDRAVVGNLRLVLGPALKLVQAHQAKAEDDDGHYLNTVNDEVCDERFDVVRCVVCLENLWSDSVPSCPCTVTSQYIVQTS